MKSLMVFKPTKLDGIFLGLAIVLAYSVNALMDAIMVVKASRGIDLGLLWHLSKYIWVGLSITTGIFIWRHVGWLLFDRGGNEGKEERDTVLQLTVSIGVALVFGFFLWEFAYQELKQIPWHTIPWA